MTAKTPKKRTATLDPMPDSLRWEVSTSDGTAEILLDPLSEYPLGVGTWGEAPTWLAVDTVDELRAILDAYADLLTGPEA